MSIPKRLLVVLPILAGVCAVVFVGSDWRGAPLAVEPDDDRGPPLGLEPPVIGSKPVQLQRDRVNAGAVVESSDPQESPQESSELQDDDLELLPVAPIELQQKACQVWTKQADAFEERAARMSHGTNPSLEQVLSEHDVRYMQRLSFLAAREAAMGRALMVPEGGGGDLDVLLRHRKYLLLGNAGKSDGVAVGVLALVPETDESLVDLEDAYRSLRALRIADSLILFNSKSSYERRRVVEQFEESQDAEIRAQLLGVKREDLPFILINKSDMTAMPKER